MQVSPNIPKSASGARTPISVRQRILEVACAMFAGTGFHGTHLREICKRAGTNVGGVCYHFHDKQGLYQAVVMEAGRRVSDYDDGLVAFLDLTGEDRVLKLVESLLTKLNAEGAWIAKLLTRELLNPGGGARNYAASGLERSFVLLQSALRELLGTRSQSETIRLHTLSLIGDCVLYSLADENQDHPLIQLAAPLPNRSSLARLIIQRSLCSLVIKDANPKVSQP